MVKASPMRRLTFRLVIASLTFAAGVMGSRLAHSPFAHSAPAGYCEVHGSTLKPARIQLICGEYSGSDGRGGWVYIAPSCHLHQYDSPKKHQISQQDALFMERGGSLKFFRWMARNEEAREAQFPHGYGWDYEDCDSGEEQCYTAYVCDECRAAEVAWKKKIIERSGP
jgi:hypothetical protein